MAVVINQLRRDRMALSNMKITATLIALVSCWSLWLFTGNATAAAGNRPTSEIRPTQVTYVYSVQFMPFTALVTGPMRLGECMRQWSGGDGIPAECKDTLRAAQRAARSVDPRLYQISVSTQYEDGKTNIWAYEGMENTEPPGLYFLRVVYGGRHTTDSSPLQISVSRRLTEAQCIDRLDAKRRHRQWWESQEEVTCFALHYTNQILGHRGCVQQPRAIARRRRHPHSEYFLCTDKEGGMPGNF
ncbi:MAG: hypothetical protein ACYCT1_05035 [Steroidobacteraceae bacterium]